MVAFVSLVPARDVSQSVSGVSAPARPRLRVVAGGLRPRAARPVAHWHRAADGTLVCCWAQLVDPDPLPRLNVTQSSWVWVQMQCPWMDRPTIESESCTF